MQHKISIVVPVYNVEKYLKRCVESLVNQAYENFEIILVDDGSLDYSGTMCDEFAEKYERVTAYHKENGGLSDARNFGLDKASGEYILFVDSDDWIALNTLEGFAKAMEKGENPDVIMGKEPIVIFEGKEENAAKQRGNEPLQTKAFDGNTYLKKALSENAYFIPVWLKLYRRELLLNNRLTFEKGILHEDELFTPLVFLKAKKVIEINLSFYYYFIRSNSITTGKNQMRNAISAYEIVKKLDKIYEKVEDRQLKRLLCNHSATIHYQALCKISKKEAEETGILDYKLLYKNSLSLKNKIRFIMARVNYNLLKKMTRVR